MQGQRDYNIKYQDGDDELINVSDDDDLQTAFEVAQKELGGSLKFVVELKKSSVPVKEKKEKKEKKTKVEKTIKATKKKIAKVLTKAIEKNEKAAEQEEEKFIVTDE